MRWLCPSGAWDSAHTLSVFSKRYLLLFFIKLLWVVTARVRGQLVPEQSSACMKRASLFAGWFVAEVRMLYSGVGSRPIKDSRDTVMERESGLWGTCVPVECTDTILSGCGNYQVLERKSCPAHLCVPCIQHRTRYLQGTSISIIDLIISSFVRAACSRHLADSAS